MEELSFEKGIFIETEDLELKFMLKCLQGVLDSCPDIKVTSVKCDDLNGGFQVFCRDSDARKLLERKYFVIGDRLISVYPLVTCLMIHGMHVSFNDEIERDLIDEIQEKFAKVVHLEKFEEQSDHPNNKIVKSVLVLLDIPEIKSLKVFRKNNYPRMSIMIPSICKTFKVSFWCRRCREQEHSRQECLKNLGTSAVDEEQQFRNSEESDKNRTETYSGNQSQMEEGPLNFAKEVANGSSTFLESTESFASMVGREVVMRTSVSLENDKQVEGQINKTKSISKITDSLWKNKSRESSNAKSGEGTSPAKSAENTTNAQSGDSPVSKEGVSNKKITSFFHHLDAKETFQNKEIKTELEPDNSKSLHLKHIKQSTQNYEEKISTLPDATSTTEDEIQILDETSNSEDSFQRRESFKEETSTSWDGIKKEPLENRSPLSPEFSQWNSRVQSAGTSSSSPQHQITSGLSDQLVGCINRAYEVHGVLDRETLDSFFIHVKKKSNPIRVSRNYTDHDQGLKAQLQQILKFYYNSPQTGTKSDTLFIKWLSGLVERFDGPVTSRKRKPSGKGLLSTPPSKK